MLAALFAFAARARADVVPSLPSPQPEAAQAVAAVVQPAAPIAAAAPAAVAPAAPPALPVRRAVPAPVRRVAGPAVHAAAPPLTALRAAVVEPARSAPAELPSAPITLSHTAGHAAAAETEPSRRPADNRTFPYVPASARQLFAAPAVRASLERTAGVSADAGGPLGAAGPHASTGLLGVVPLGFDGLLSVAKTAAAAGGSGSPVVLAVAALLLAAAGRTGRLDLGPNPLRGTPPLLERERPD
ncbi:MAG TPA: hypothetical protein VFA30_07625 [Gaiellaceae bacterium]|nr:hypothetical protein [Gaiellaceae bacterium]